MNDPRMVDTFALFDADASGTIDAKELEGLVQMLVPNPHPALVREMQRELDVNGDGEVDLWEFCAHMQKRSDGLTNDDLEMELDEAFQLFQTDDKGLIDEAELRRLLCDPCRGTPLDEEEVQAMLNELARFGLNLRGGAKVPLRELRRHPIYTVADQHLISVDTDRIADQG